METIATGKEESGRLHEEIQIGTLINSKWVSNFINSLSKPRKWVASARVTWLIQIKWKRNERSADVIWGKWN